MHRLNIVDIDAEKVMIPSSLLLAKKQPQEKINFPTTLIWRYVIRTFSIYLPCTTYWDAAALNEKHHI